MMDTPHINHAQRTQNNTFEMSIELLEQRIVSALIDVNQIRLRNTECEQLLRLTMSARFDSRGLSFVSRILFHTLWV